MRISYWSSDVCSSDLILPIARGWRLLIVCLSLLAFLGWTMLFAGSQIADQAATLQTVVMAQIERIVEWASDHGMGSFQLDTKTIADNIAGRSEEQTSELQSLMRNSYAVFCLKKKKHKQQAQ